MKAITQGSGCYWKTDDEAALSFNEVNQGGPPPSTLICYNLDDSLNRGPASSVQIDSMTFLGAGLFGEARPSHGIVRWTGNSHKFGVYEVSEGFSRKLICILVAHGGGMRGYLLPQIWAVDAWRLLAITLSKPALWDLCHTVIDAYEEGRKAERHKIYGEFIDGRLKKKRHKGRVYVEATPEATPV